MGRIIWNKELVFKRAADFETRTKFARGASGAYDKAWKNGWLNELDDVFGAPVCPGSLNRVWTLEKILLVAKKYSSRKAFAISVDSAAYGAAQKMGALSVIGAVFGEKIKSSHSWELTLAESLLLAKQYKYRSDFKDGSPGAYKRVSSAKLMDDACDHMPNHRNGFDDDAVYIWCAKGERFKNKCIFKVGVTSVRLGSWRVGNCSNKTPFSSELVILRATNGRATIVERLLLGIGSDPGLSGFDGATEFRAMNDEELAEAVELIGKHAM